MGQDREERGTVSDEGVLEPKERSDLCSLSFGRYTMFWGLAATPCILWNKVLTRLSAAVVASMVY